MDFKAKFPQAVDPFFYTPIPELTLPGDDATISPEWATGKTQDGIAIKMLQAQPLLPQSALSACLLPVTIDSTSWTKFIAQIDTIVKIQLRDQRWNFQKEIKTLNDEKDEIETELSQVKDRHRLELTTANSERATEFDRMTAEIQRLSRLATESNQKATEPGTSKDPDLKSVIATRDRYKRERDEAYYQLDNLQDVIDGKIEHFSTKKRSSTSSKSRNETCNSGLSMTSTEKAPRTMSHKLRQSDLKIISRPSPPW